MQVATEVANEARFVHYDLIFADILKARGGFDLIVGNPPWAKPNWNEGQVLADLDPLYSGMSASDAKNAMAGALKKSGVVSDFLHEYSLTRGGMEVTSSPVMNPFIGGGSNNLYRCFMDLTFRLTAPQGYAALIHQDGHLGDPSAGSLRRHWYGRIAKHFYFRNIMKNKMFAEVNHQTDFSMNIYRGDVGEIGFDQFTGAFLPSQIEESYADSDGAGELPGNKNAEGNWDIRGHRDRIVRIDRKALANIHALSEEATVPVEEARFIQPFSSSTLEVFKKLASFPKMGAALLDERGEPTWQMAGHWHETNAQKDGTIKRATAFRSLEEMVIQGPSIYVSNPLYKSPRRGCKNSKDYDVIDLVHITPRYLPRTNYGPAIDMDEYRRRTTNARWNRTKSHGDFYRLALRRMISLSGERSLTSAIIPPKLLHVNGIESIATRDIRVLLDISSIFSSLVMDSFVKASGIANLFSSDVARFPLAKVPYSAVIRTLKLNCLTSEYRDLWESIVLKDTKMEWSVDLPCLIEQGNDSLSPTWSEKSPLRAEYPRRLALVEIDVIVARAFGLELEQLIELYRIYFPVLQENDTGTYFDQNGRIVWTCAKGVAGVGYLEQKGKSPGRKEWESILESKPAELVCSAIDDTLPDGPHIIERHFVGPFFKCDRVEDYKRAWAHFEKLEQEGAA